MNNPQDFFLFPLLHTFLCTCICLFFQVAESWHERQLALLITINHKIPITLNSSRYIVYTMKLVSQDHHCSQTSYCLLMFITIKVTRMAVYGWHPLRISSRLLVFLAGVSCSFLSPQDKFCVYTLEKLWPYPFKSFVARYSRPSSHFARHYLVKP